MLLFSFSCCSSSSRLWRTVSVKRQGVADRIRQYFLRSEESERGMNIDLVAPHLAGYKELLASGELGPEMHRWITEMVDAYEAKRDAERLAMAASARVGSARSRRTG